MPHKGFFTQAVSVLLDGETTLDDVANCLREYEVVGRARRGRNGLSVGRG